MRRLFILAAILLAPAAALADDMVFYMKNGTGTAIAVELRSQVRDYLWPGGDQVYLLEKDEKKSVTIGCDAGEKICYAAWLNGNDQVTWGVGPDGDHVCTDCCRVCVASATETLEIGR